MVPPQIKKAPFPSPVSWISLALQLLLPFSLPILSLGLQLHQVFISKQLVLHSKEFSEVVLLQIWLEIKTLYYCTAHSTQKYTKAQPLVRHACTWQRMPISYVIGHTNTHSHLWKFAAWRVCMYGIYCRVRSPFIYLFFFTGALGRQTEEMYTICCNLTISPENQQTTKAQRLNPVEQIQLMPAWLTILENRNHTYSSCHFNVKCSSRLKIKAQGMPAELKESRLARAQVWEERPKY